MFRRQEMFGDRAEQTRFAVRSSAVGEDGDDLSSAGQNATILGCRGLDAVVTGLAQCWASLFAFQSVEYRRQHGQPLVPGSHEFSVAFCATFTGLLGY